jgi:hypothetical protein
MLANDASFRLVVSGNIGVKEIERPIKEILADQDRVTNEEAANWGGLIVSPERLAVGAIRSPALGYGERSARPGNPWTSADIGLT